MLHNHEAFVLVIMFTAVLSGAQASETDLEQRLNSSNETDLNQNFRKLKEQALACVIVRNRLGESADMYCPWGNIGSKFTPNSPGLGLLSSSEKHEAGSDLVAYANNTAGVIVEKARVLNLLHLLERRTGIRYDEPLTEERQSQSNAAIIAGIVLYCERYTSRDEPVIVILRIIGCIPVLETTPSDRGCCAVS
jgi:hypothetical protein